MWKLHATNHNLSCKIIMVKIVAKVVEFYIVLELLLKLWKAQLRPRWPENPDSFQTLEVSSLSDLLKYEGFSSSIG